jgi:hypothetical protein
VRATYRKGIGAAGNVKAGALAQLLDRPLGVKGVENPRRRAAASTRSRRIGARIDPARRAHARPRRLAPRLRGLGAPRFSGVAKATPRCCARAGRTSSSRRVRGRRPDRRPPNASHARRPAVQVLVLPATETSASRSGRGRPGVRDGRSRRGRGRRCARYSFDARASPSRLRSRIAVAHTVRRLGVDVDRSTRAPAGPRDRLLAQRPPSARRDGDRRGPARARRRAASTGWRRMT